MQGQGHQQLLNVKILSEAYLLHVWRDLSIT
jgi:hypothetical protein